MSILTKFQVLTYHQGTARNRLVRQMPFHLGRVLKIVPDGSKIGSLPRNPCTATVTLRVQVGVVRRHPRTFLPQAIGSLDLVARPKPISRDPLEHRTCSSVVASQSCKTWRSESQLHGKRFPFLFSRKQPLGTMRLSNFNFDPRAASNIAAMIRGS